VTGSQLRNMQDLNHLLNRPGVQQGVAVMQFPGNRVNATVALGFKALGHPVVVEVDDDYTCAPANPLTAQWVRRMNAEDVSSEECHRLICRDIADAIIVSTGVLRERYARFGKPVFVCRNGVMPEDWPGPEPRDEVFRIGWAGSRSHMHDLRLVERALSWAADQPGVEVVQLGSLPFRHLVSIEGTGEFHDDGREKAEMVWGAEKFPHRTVPWTDDLAEYRRNLVSAKIDLGLCPLRRNQWSDAKSDLKALEYAVAGGCPAVSNSPAYRPWLGWELVADDEADWRKIVRWAVGNRDRVRDLAVEARDLVLRERSMHVLADEWKEAFEGAEQAAQ
jgi:hypothetical protein